MRTGRSSPADPLLLTSTFPKPFRVNHFHNSDFFLGPDENDQILRENLFSIDVGKNRGSATLISEFPIVLLHFG
jgi:hypothetical protein